MPNDRLRLVGLLQMLHLLIGQGLALDINRLIQSSHIAETHDRNGASLDDPSLFEQSQ